MDEIAGTVESNSQTSEAMCLTIKFHQYNLRGPIYYPPFDKVLCSYNLRVLFGNYSRE